MTLAPSRKERVGVNGIAKELIPPLGFKDEEWLGALYMCRPNEGTVAVVMCNAAGSFSLWFIPRRHPWDKFMDFSSSTQQVVLVTTDLLTIICMIHEQTKVT